MILEGKPNSYRDDFGQNPETQFLSRRVQKEGQIPIETISEYGDSESGEDEDGRPNTADYEQRASPYPIFNLMGPLRLDCASSHFKNRDGNGQQLLQF